MFRVLGFAVSGICIFAGFAAVRDIGSGGLYLVAFGVFGLFANYYGGIGGMWAAFRTSQARLEMADEIKRASVASTTNLAALSGGDSINMADTLAAIDAFYANELNPVTASVAAAVPSLLTRQAIERGVVDAAQKISSDLRQMNAGDSVTLGVLKDISNKSDIATVAGGIEGAVFTRTLRDMTEAERATLRLGAMLQALGILTSQDVLRATLPIVWNEGKCAVKMLSTISSPDKQAAVREGLKVVILGTFGNATAAAELVQEGLRKALGENGLAPDVRSMLERYVVRGARWMTPTEGKTALISDPNSPTALRLGTFTGSPQELLYDMNESLLTIAPPGQGKSQAHVLRNLLHMNGPAVVLDIKGEMFSTSARWRSANVGNVYVYAPSLPHLSKHYNPLDGVRDNPEYAWDDAKKLADLLVVPSTNSSGNTYFEDRSRDILATALADVALTEPDERRNMATVLDRIYVSEDERIIEWCDHLAGINTQLRRQADALRGMPAKQREGVFDSARRHLDVWQSPSVETISDKSEFSADLLRKENATLYLVVPLEDIKRLAPVLRVIIGQTINSLCRGEAEAGAKPVTFFLDEFPQLGRMDVIEQGLDLGRGFGVRFWLFCQNLGQLEKAYQNFQGIISGCAVRSFMNPDETAAKWLSQNLGQREGLIDGTRKPLVEPHQLTGPEFAEHVVVFLRKHHPARLDKRPAYADPVTAERMTKRG